MTCVALTRDARWVSRTELVLSSRQSVVVKRHDCTVMLKYDKSARNRRQRAVMSNVKIRAIDGVGEGEKG